MDPFLDEDRQSGPGFDPMSLLRAFWRRKLLFFIPFILCLAMAIVVIKTMTPIYESSGQILIKFNPMNSNLLDDPSRRYGRVRNIDEMAFHEMDMLLTSPEFLDMMVVELGLYRALRDTALVAAADSLKGAGEVPDERAVRRARNRLRSMLRLKNTEARIFRIAVRDPDPELAFQLAAYILPRFVEEYRASQAATSTSTREFLERQLGIYRTKLANAEKDLTDFQASMASAALVDNPINSVNLGVAEDNIAALRERYETLDAEELAQYGRTVLELLGSVPEVRPFQEDQVAKSTLSEMQDLGIEMMVYREGDPGRAELDNRLGLLRVRLNNRVEEMVALQYPALAFLERNQVSQYVYFTLFRHGVKHVLDETERMIRDFRDFSSRRPGQSARLAELQAEVTSARGLVQSIESEITQQTMNLEASRSEIGMQIRVREAPTKSYRPVEPDKMKLMMLGVVLSLGIGMGLVVLAFLLDRSFKTVEDIERTLGVAVIGTLPVIQDEHFEQRKKLRILRWVVIVLGVLAVAAVGFLVVYPRLG